MSSYIDKKYINLMSSSLQRFKWTRENLAICRCPLCGDSDRSKVKARGYFYKKGNDFFYRCHNCNIGHNIYNMLDRVVPTLCKQYALERYTVGEDGNSNYKKPTTEELYPFTDTEIKFDTIEYTKISELPETHRCVSFLKRRLIPTNKWDEFGYTENFGKFAKQFNDSYSLSDEERLLILIRDESGKIIGAQGRQIGQNNKIPKYITIKKNDEKLIYGIHNIDKTKPITIVEGPIDSMFIPNAIACLGTGKFLDMVNLYPNAVYVIDNEPRNRQVVSILEQLIDLNIKVCIYPNFWYEKDVNDMVKKHKRKEVLQMIADNTFSGPKAKLLFNHWKKV